jgi:polysaccharide biosynthesis protein VpsJ
MTPSDALIALLAQAEALHWTGPDPYDGLESLIGTLAKPLGPFPRFAVAQATLRYPAFRQFASPARTLNPKALGLFLGAAVRGREVLGEPRASNLIASLLVMIAKRGTPAALGVGWGYPFAWQSRYFWAPAGTPNAVVTSTVTWHLLECADLTGDKQAMEMGCAGGRYLATGLNRTQDGDGEAISYTANDATQVVNVSALTARALVRSASYERTPLFQALAERLVRFVVAAQRKDGSWPYSMDARGKWEDSFHTGYVLESLVELQELGMNVPERTLGEGFEAYRRFFGPEGQARLHARADSVLDAHSAAQGILTYAALARSPRATEERRVPARAAALRIADWALRELWLPKHGHFAYRIQGASRDEREFTRWVSAWMALAMATAGSLVADSAPQPAGRHAGVGTP